MPVYSNWIKRLVLKTSVAVKGDRGSSPCAGVNASIAKWIRQRSTKPRLGVRLSLLALYRLKIKKKNLKFLKIFDIIYLVNEKKAPFGKWSKPCDFLSHIAGSNPARSIQ